MNEDAKAFLGKSLIQDGVLEAIELPFSDDDLWLGVEEGAREDWSSFSYFVVREESSERRDLFVSSNWPVAERFAKLTAIFYADQKNSTSPNTGSASSR